LSSGFQSAAVNPQQISVSRQIDFTLRE